MALLTLVRHGQAAFLEQNYDRLTPLGERQARLLGEYWLRTSTTFDQVYRGPAERRVDRAIALIRDGSGKNGRVVGFTSGGVIAATVRIALDLAAQRTLELSWTSRNASYSEFLFTIERFSLSSFNNHPHLEGPELLTYR